MRSAQFTCIINCCLRTTQKTPKKLCRRTAGVLQLHDPVQHLQPSRGESGGCRQPQDRHRRLVSRLVGHGRRYLSRQRLPRRLRAQGRAGVCAGVYSESAFFISVMSRISRRKKKKKLRIISFYIAVKYFFEIPC